MIGEILFLVWLLGAWVSVFLMFIANILILNKDPLHEPYVRKDFILGFCASWVSVGFVYQTFSDHFKSF
jgi:hypothetical protein